MSSKHPDNDIDKIFKGAIDPVETEPSDKFWNKAYEDILRRDNGTYVRQVRQWKTISYILAASIILLAVYLFYVHGSITKIERQITQVEKKQSQTATSGTEHTTIISHQSELGNTATQNNTSQSQPSITTTNPTISQQKLKTAPANTDAFSSPGLIRNSKISGDANNNLMNVKGSNYISHGSSGNTSPGNYSNASSNANQNTTPAAATQPVASVTAPSDTSHSPGHEQTPATNTLPGNPPPTASNVTPPDTSTTGNTSAASTSNGTAKNSAITTALAKIFVSAFFSPDLLYNHIKSNNGWTASNEINSREENNFIYTTGIRVGYNITKHWAIQVGGYYQSTYFSIRPTELEAQPYNGQPSAYLMVTSAGNLDVPCSYSWGNDSIRTSGSTTVTYACVPVQVRYTASLNKHFGFYVIAGGTGSFLLNNNSDVYWETPSDNEGSAKLQACEGLQQSYYSYNAGFGITYNIAKGFSVFGEPAFDGAVTPSNKNSDISSYPYTLGLRVGLTLQL